MPSISHATPVSAGLESVVAISTPQVEAGGTGFSEPSTNVTYPQPDDIAGTLATQHAEDEQGVILIPLASIVAASAERGVENVIECPSSIPARETVFVDEGAVSTLSPSECGTPISSSVVNQSGDNTSGSTAEPVASGTDVTAGAEPVDTVDEIQPPHDDSTEATTPSIVDVILEECTAVEPVPEPTDSRSSPVSPAPDASPSLPRSASAAALAPLISARLRATGDSVRLSAAERVAAERGVRDAELAALKSERGAEIEQVRSKLRQRTDDPGSGVLVGSDVVTTAAAINYAKLAASSSSGSAVSPGGAGSSAGGSDGHGSRASLGGGERAVGSFRRVQTRAWGDLSEKVVMGAQSEIAAENLRPASENIRSLEQRRAGGGSIGGGAASSRIAKEALASAAAPESTALSPRSAPVPSAPPPLVASLPVSPARAVPAIILPLPAPAPVSAPAPALAPAGTNARTAMGKIPKPAGPNPNKAAKP